MAKTRTHLANAALDKLLLVGSGQSPDSEDTQTADGVIDSFVEYLSEADIYTVSDLSDIDEKAFEPLSDYLAWFIAPRFGKPREEQMRQMAEYMLKLVTSGKPSYEVAQTEHF